MIRFLLVFILLTNSVYAVNADLCEVDPQEQLTSQVVDVAEKMCAQRPMKSPTEVIGGCLTGIADGGKALVSGVEAAAKGFWELVKMFIKFNSDVHGKIGEGIQTIISGDLNPAEMATAIANVNIGAHEKIWEDAKAFAKSVQEAGAQMMKTLWTGIKGFPCKPADEQMKLICRGFTEVVLVVVPPIIVVKGASWAGNLAKALNQFMKESNHVTELSHLSLADRLNAATKAMSQARKGDGTLLSLRNSKVIETELPNGEKIIQYQQQIRDKEGKVHYVTREVPLDAKTLAIDSNSVIGKEILTEAVKGKSGSGSLVFIDVNHLGKVNYFKNGTQGGDQYLASVAESLRKTLRPGDMIFKNGGDELVVVLGTNNPKAVKDLTQRMMNEVDSNPQVRQIFRNEVKSLTEQYKDVNKAKSFSDIPEKTKSLLTKEESDLARTNFVKFQETKKAQLLEDSVEQSTYRGSISVGASTVKQEETLEAVLKRAEAKASAVKTEYKLRYGHDVSKYNVDTSEITIGRRYGPPKALEVD